MNPAPGPIRKFIASVALPPRAEQQFGAIALRNGLVTAERLAEALAIQRNAHAGGGGAPRLGDLLVDRGWMTPADAAEVRRLQAAAEVVMDLPGYRLRDEIGRGQSGRVVRAIQVSMDRVVAIKILHPHLSGDAVLVARFVREARSVARLSHPNVVQGIDVGCARGVHYFVMEYVDGSTLRSHLVPGQPLDERYALGVAIQVARALQHAHENGMIHRDVKPANVLLGKDRSVKLADLGLATSLGGATRGAFTGTPAYMSPEQVRGQDDLDGRTDLYSLGCMLFHLVTGRAPFSGTDVTEVLGRQLHEAPPDARLLNPAVSIATASLIQWAMAKSRDSRPPSGQSFVGPLESSLAALTFPSAIPQATLLPPSPGRSRLQQRMSARRHLR